MKDLEVLENKVTSITLEELNEEMKSIGPIGRASEQEVPGFAGRLLLNGSNEI